MSGLSATVEQVITQLEVCEPITAPPGLSLDPKARLLIPVFYLFPQRNQDATVYVGGLDERVDDDLLWELFAQVGPVVSVHMPKDKVTGSYQGYGFVEFRGEDDAEYAVKVLNMTKLYGKPMRISKASADKAKLSDVGANLFIGNLAPEVDEKVLYDTFSAFGGITGQTKVMRDPDSGVSKGFGFVSYDSFEASDLAIECMNGQFLANRQIVVQYALRKDSKGERHGSHAERLLASAAKKAALRPHTMFAAAPGAVTSIVPQGAGGPMLGQAVAAAPVMLPPTAILPSSFSATGTNQMPLGVMRPPPLPPQAAMGAALAVLPPPLPSGFAAGGMVAPPLPPMGR